MRMKLSIALVAALTLVACGPTGAGTDGDGVTPTSCQVSATESTVAAGSLAEVDGVPDDAVEILAWHGSEEVAIATMPDGDAAVLAPFPDPDDLFARGPVTIDMEIDGEPCGSLTLQVTGLPLPDDPGVAGGFRRMVDDAVESVDEALRQAGLTREELLDDAASGDAAHSLLFAIDFLVRGEDNPNALTRILEDERVVEDGESVAVDLDVLDSVVAMMARNAASAAPSASAVELGSQAAPPSDLRTWASTPSGLAQVLEMQHDAEHVRGPQLDVTLAVGAASALALSFTGGGAVVGSIGFVGTLVNWMTVKRDIHLLPNDVALTFEISSDPIFEDGAGAITSVHLLPENQGGFDAAKMAIDVILSGLSIKTNRKPAMLRDLVESLVITVLQRINSDDRISLLPTPPYEWPPTEVPLTDLETWVVARGADVELVPGGSGAFEPTTTGALTLTLALRGERFGYRDVSHDASLTVEPIEVKVFPGRVELESGVEQCFVASVQKAADPGYVWLTESGESSDEFHCWTAPTPAELEEPCEDATTVEHEVIARSTSQDGARRPKHDPPPRTGTATAVVACNPYDLTGTWSGSFTSTVEDGGGTLEAVLQQDGSTLTGTVNVTGSPCISSGSISGTVSAAGASFGAVQGPHTVAYSTSSVGDASMSGTYSVTSDDCSGGAGVFSLVRSP